MISKKVQDAFNEQIKFEMNSAYLYLSMAAYCHTQNWDGMASWMKAQAKEEENHAMKFFNHIVERDGRIELQAIDMPKRDWETPRQMFQEAHQHEQMITGRINALMKMAIDESDYAAKIFLEWFITEQIEEEAQVAKVANHLEKMDKAPCGLFLLDQELGKREG